MQTINLIQDLATPHNNVLISAFTEKPGARLNVWYARDQDQKLYPWRKNISHEHYSARIYGNRFNWEFIRYCLKNSHEKFVIVGWMNINTSLLHIIFFLLRRPFNHWTDTPSAHSSNASLPQKISRWLAYKLLRYSRAKVFCVGVTAMKQFRHWGFPEEKLVNLPIFVKTNEDLPALLSRRNDIYARYKLFDDTFIVSAGSRLFHEKGYDLLIQAVSLLDKQVLEKTRVIIVGNGVDLEKLKNLAETLHLGNQIIFESWLDIDDFKALIANSSVFVHPSRFDAYGGTTLGMALGVPVIGSYQAGAAADRIVHERNGYLYDAEDTKTLAKHITHLFADSDLRKRMGEEARKTALLWPPERGADIILQNAI